MITPITFVHEMRPVALLDGEPEPMPVSYDRAEMYQTEAVYLDGNQLRTTIVSLSRITVEKIGWHIAQHKMREAALEQIFERAEGVPGGEN